MSQPTLSKTINHLPHDIRNPYIYEFDYTWIIRAGLFFVFLGLVTILYFWWRKKSRLKQTSFSKPRHTKVIQEMLELEVISPFSKTHQIEFFYRLSLLFREIIEITCAIPATDLTWKELRGPLQVSTYFSDEDKAETKAFFERADRIKFADDLTTIEQAIRAKSTIMRISEHILGTYLTKLDESKGKLS